MTDREWSKPLLFRAGERDAVALDDVFADLQRIEQLVRAMPASPVRLDVPGEVLALLEELPARTAVSLLMPGDTGWGVPILRDDELPAHTARVHYSDGTKKLLDVRNGTTRPEPPT